VADPVNEFVDRAIERAIGAVKELMGSELRGIRNEMRALNEKFERVDRIETRVEGIDSRLTATEAFRSQHEHRLKEIEEAKPETHEQRLARLEREANDRRRWLREHAPALVLGIGSLAVAIAALLGA
jgi:DNA repair exonuclease SbcCD ATPase subunit